MTDKDRTHLLMISDRSGSMQHHQHDTEGGINAFLDEQKKVEGECDLTFVEFDTVHDTVYDGPLAKFTRYTLRPRGGTALLDAIGFGVTKLGERLAKLEEDKRPGTVVVVISTDGQENSSEEWRRDQIKSLLEQQQNGYQWQVIFLGANIDAVAEGGSIGIRTANAMTFDQNNVIGTYAAASANIGSYRGQRSAGISHSVASASTGFTDDQRKDAVDVSKKPKASTSR